MLLDVEGAMELLRGVPIAGWLLFSVALLSAHVSPANSVHDFAAYRMQHYDLHGARYGSRSAVVNMEMRGEAASMLNRKCVVLKWAELTVTHFLNLVHRGAGALVLLLPPEHLVEEEEVESWRELEAEILKSEVPIPVYFAREDEGLRTVYQDANLAAEQDTNTSVVRMLLSGLTGFGYQIVSDQVKEPEAVKDSRVSTITGKLSGLGMEHTLPTVALVAHYDAFGLAPSLSHGYDSNGSGVVALMELARLFSRLYSDLKQRPKYNLLFILTGAGKLNYFGTKAYLDDQVEDLDSSLLASADYSLCLDSLAGHPELHLHVSKPPREGSRAFALVSSLNQSAQRVDSQIRIVHKKIRLNSDLLAWEHERFSLKKLSAGTLSSLHGYKDRSRSSMFVPRSNVSVGTLERNVKIIAEGLARHIYDLPHEEESAAEVFSGALDVQEDSLASWLELLFLHPRSPQLLSRDHPTVLTLEQGFSKYLQEVAVLSHRPDKSDPEFVMYNVPSTTMHAYKVKPAIFDLFLALFIVAYILLWYLVVACFERFMPFMESFASLVKIKAD